MNAGDSRSIDKEAAFPRILCACGYQGEFHP